MADEKTKEKKYVLKSTYACPTQTVGMGNIVTMDEKAAKKFLKAGIVEEYQGKTKPITHIRYETATKKDEPPQDDPPKKNKGKGKSSKGKQGDPSKVEGEDGKS